MISKTAERIKIKGDHMTYIEFFDTEAVENICSSLISAPERVVLIGDNKKTLQKHAQKYHGFFLKRGENIEFIWNSVPEAFLGEGKLSGVRLRNRVTGEVSELSTDGVFVAVGVVPRTELFGDRLALAENGSVITDEQMQTSIPGVFAAGDVNMLRADIVGSAAAESSHTVRKFFSVIQ